jgi:hypothetical protein
MGMNRKQRLASRRRAVFKSLKLFAIAISLIVVTYVSLVVFPQTMFFNHITYQNYEIWSDRTIPPQINQVLDDATRRLRTSELYEPNQQINIFFCNDLWRLWFHTFDDQVAASTDTWVTNNIYVRPSDITANRFYAPDTKPIPDLIHRPLSYVIAHEVTHVIEALQFKRPLKLRYPNWSIEGYADYIAKAGDFDFDENRRLLKLDSPLLDVHRSGLYRRFHLEVAYLIDKKGMTVRQLFNNPPQENELLAILRSDADI